MMDPPSASPVTVPEEAQLRQKTSNAFPTPILSSPSASTHLSVSSSSQSKQTKKKPKGKPGPIPKVCPWCGSTDCRHCHCPGYPDCPHEGGMCSRPRYRRRLVCNPCEKHKCLWKRKNTTPEERAAEKQRKAEARQRKLERAAAREKERAEKRENQAKKAKAKKSNQRKQTNPNTVNFFKDIEENVGHLSLPDSLIQWQSSLDTSSGTATTSGVGSSSIVGGNSQRVTGVATRQRLNSSEVRNLDNFDYNDILNDGELIGELLEPMSSVVGGAGAGVAANGSSNNDVIFRGRLNSQNSQVSASSVLSFTSAAAKIAINGLQPEEVAKHPVTPRMVYNDLNKTVRSEFRDFSSSSSTLSGQSGMVQRQKKRPRKHSLHDDNLNIERDDLIHLNLKGIPNAFAVVPLHRDEDRLSYVRNYINAVLGHEIRGRSFSFLNIDGTVIKRERERNLLAWDNCIARDWKHHTFADRTVRRFHLFLDVTSKSKSDSERQEANDLIPTLGNKQYSNKNKRKRRSDSIKSNASENEKKNNKSVNLEDLYANASLGLQELIAWNLFTGDEEHGNGTIPPAKRVRRRNPSVDSSFESFL
eukprot:g1423.t1